MSASSRRRRPAPPPAQGAAIKWVSHSPEGELWLIGGWAPEPWPSPSPAEFEFERGTLVGDGTTAFAPAAGGFDFVFGLRAGRPPIGAALRLRMDARSAALSCAPAAAVEADVALRVARDLARRAEPDAAVALRALLPAPRYDGRETVSALGLPSRVMVERCVSAGDGGLILLGWLVDPQRHLTSIFLVGGDVALPLHSADWAAMSRPDVLDAIGRGMGASTDELGFIALANELPTGFRPDCLRVETRCGMVGFVPLPQPTQDTALSFIRHLLASARAPADRLRRVIGRTLGPAVRTLNEARLALRPAPRRIDHGPQPPRPKRAIVVPLYGRLDFMEYQLALFSERPDSEAEVIYVLDDPSLAEEADRLAASAWRRFGLPFSLLHLDANLGFAPACNAGARVARAPALCLLNSDVFPLPGGGLAWLDALCSPLAQADVGAVGALLLYEDGTVQHAGMEYAVIPEYPVGRFPIHTGKGRRPGPEQDVVEAEAVTAACIAVRRREFLEEGGFDESLVVGDFEDAMLCAALKAGGKRVLLHRGVRLYHLERQTQGGGAAWRLNLTLVNAARFEAAWGSADA